MTRTSFFVSALLLLLSIWALKPSHCSQDAYAFTNMHHSASQPKMHHPASTTHAPTHASCNINDANPCASCTGCCAFPSGHPCDGVSTVSACIGVLKDISSSCTYNEWSNLFACLNNNDPDQQETEAVLDLLAAESKTKSKANAKWFSCWRATLVAAFVLGISTETCACSLGDVCTHVL